MKEAFFTPENIDPVGKKIIEGLSRQRIPENIQGNTALLILDMQDYFLREESHAFVSSAEAIVSNIIQLAEKFNSNGYPVYLTQHLNVQGQAGMMEEWWDDLLTEDHPHMNISSEMSQVKGKLIKKSQYDAFYKTELLDELKKNEITDVVITGVMTHLCCETTGRAAFVNGFRVWFVVDGTATYNKEFHLNSIRNLDHGFAYPILTSELMKLLEK